MDPDLFVEGIEDLELSDRARRALRESLAAFRRGLDLAAASLLGVVSEAAAWYSAAETLGKPGRIEEAFRRTRTADLQGLVAGLSASGRLAGRPSLTNSSHARRSFASSATTAFTRRRSATTSERFFSEEECGLLILTTHRYLVDLAAATAEAVRAEMG